MGLGKFIFHSHVSSLLICLEFYLQNADGAHHLQDAIISTVGKYWVYRMELHLQ